jgi:hypothetical protein
MLSPDFLASDFIDQDELPPLVEAAAKDHAVILQVVLGPIIIWRVLGLER